MNLLFQLVFFLTASLLSTQDVPLEYTYVEPEDYSGDWETASLEEVGMDIEVIESLMDELSLINEHYFHSILIAKNNKLVFEEYFHGQDADLTNYKFELDRPVEFNKDTLHFMASATKSITSILTGIALDKGFFSSTNQKMFSFFPEYSGMITRRMDQITIYHLLTMTSGTLISEDFAYSDPRNELNQMWHATDPIGYALAKPLLSRPGKSFIYNSGSVNILGEIIRRQTGMPLAEFAENYLFKPLGIENYKWIGFENDKQMAFASTALYLRPRDMAKLGQLYLQNGIWSGDTIVSPDWISQSTKRAVLPTVELMADFHTDGYGYLWWLEQFQGGAINAYSARGHGLQFIVVLPEADAVVVFTGGAWNISPVQAPVQFHNIIEDYILRSMQ